jgi:hypothetical protein
MFAALDLGDYIASRYIVPVAYVVVLVAAAWPVVASPDLRHSFLLLI